MPGFREGQEVMAIHQIDAHQQGNHLALVAEERTRPLDERGYKWRGEFRLWDNESHISWYRAADARVRSKGSMYFSLHRQGRHAVGQWVELSYDGDVQTGIAVIARDRDLLDEHIQKQLEEASQ